MPGSSTDTPPPDFCRAAAWWPPQNAICPKAPFSKRSRKRKNALPDAVLILSPCSIGNQRLKIPDLRRYAVTLYDKYTGKGVRVSLSVEKLRGWPELHSWFMKAKSKSSQDEGEILREIEEAGDTVCDMSNVTVSPGSIGRPRSGSIAVCPFCGEAYPMDHGPVCRACQGEAHYHCPDAPGTPDQPAAMTVLPAGQAAGMELAHDVTEIVPGGPGALFSGKAMS